MIGLARRRGFPGYTPRRQPRLPGSVKPEGKPLSDSLALGRYDILRRLGAGGCGEVFLARDRLGGSLVALKRPQPSEPSPVRLMAEEFSAVAPLTHPGLARVLDFAPDDGAGRPFLVYEAIEGAPSGELAPRSDSAGVLGWAAGVAETLDFLHQAGLCHGDLKPENIFITPRGIPKLIDFGLARAPGESGGGSPATVAPELLAGGRLNERGDLFSLGATIFFWLFARYPFGDSLAVRLRGLDRRVAMPAELDIPRDVRTLLRSLLSPAPAERPASAREVVLRLAAAGVGLPDPALADPESRARSLPLLERDAALEALASGWRAGASTAGFVALVGPPGSGRSRLLEETARRARVAGRFVAALRPEAGAALGAQVLRAVAVDSGSGPRAAGSAPLAVALGVAAQAHALTVLIHDADRLAESDLAEVLRLPDRLAQNRSVFVAAALDDAPASPGWRAVELAALSLGAAADIVRAILPGPPLSAAFRERLHRATGGRPGAVAQLAIEAARRGLAVSGPGGWDLGRLEQAALETLTGDAPPPGVALEFLAPEQRAVAQAMAALDSPASLPLLASGAGLAVAAGAVAARELVLARIARREADGALVLTELGRTLFPAFKTPPPTVAGRLFARLAAERPTHPGERAVRLGRLARLAALADHPELAARLLRRAVSAALGLGRPDLASGLVGSAALEPGSLAPLGRALLEEAAGEIHLAAGRPADARPALADAARLFDEAGRTARAVRAAARLARALGDMGRRDDALEVVAAARARAACAVTRSAVLLEEGVLAAREQNYIRAIACFDEALAGAPENSLLAARAHAARARCLVLTGHVEEGLLELSRARQLPAAARDAALAASIRLAELQAALRSRRPRRVLDMAAGVRERLLARGEADGLGQLAALASDAHLELGEYEGALAAAEESVRWREIHGRKNFLSAAEDRLARVQLLIGDLPAARASAQRAVDAGRAADADDRVAAALTTLARAFALEGRSREAVRAATGALSHARAASDPVVEAEARFTLAAVRGAGGEGESSAAALLEALETLRRVGGWRSLEAEGLALYAESLAARDPAAAGAGARRALALADEWGDLDSAVAALAAVARASVARGDDAGAAQAWDRARARIEEAATRMSAPARARLFRARADRAAVLARTPGSGAAQRLAALYEIVADLNSHREPASVVATLIDRALAATGAERGAVVLAAPDGALRVAVSRRVEPETAKDALDLSRTALQRAHHGEAILAVDPAADPRLAGAESVRLFAIRAVLCVPLRSRERAVGALYLDTRDPERRFDADDLKFLEALAHHAALALENARAFDRLAAENERLRADLGRRDRMGPMVGASAPMVRLFEAIEAAAPAAAPVLVTGESGAGKELIARALHRLGANPEGPFVAVNCAALPESILEAELFGHEKGAFTGADQARIGLIERAHGGTLLLDEIGDMSLAMQSKLLRTLEDGEVRPLGARECRPVRVRVVAATNRDLAEEVAAGRFRHDLFFRLDVLRLRAPPLRDRLEDLPLLVGHILERLASSFGPLRATPEFVARLARWSWPGNVRELENTLTRLALQAKNGVISTDVLAHAPDLAARFGLEAPPDGPASLEGVEREAFRRALEISGGNREQAARLLGVGRATVFRKIRQYRLEKVGRAKRV